ncbi:HNH endonuclease signature motif containing protein [Leucobacter sp. USCH14]|uniref:HNH endonuclease n=1 Tax=Leucobacter sp. USCH14 TaxID=3024838 RepID=UPI0030A24814
MSNKRTGPVPAKTVEKLVERSGGMCEGGCGRPAEEIHHRRYLSRSGKHNLANLLALCGDGNHDNGKCHGIAHRGSKAPPGWAISRHERRHESEVPYVDLGGRTQWLDDEGGRHDRPQDRGRSEGNG